MKKIYLFLIGLFIISGCLEKPMFEIEETISEFSNFDFLTTKETSLAIHLSDASGTPFQGVKISVYEFVNETEGKKLFTAVTNESGELNEGFSLPAYFEKVLVKTDFIGIPNNLIVPIIGNQIIVNYQNGELMSETIEDNAPQSSGSAANLSNDLTAINIQYMGEYENRTGLPKYLEDKRDKISKTLLEYINASLPESKPVPEFHPTYLANGKKTTLEIIELADVWITFVHEGAGWTNALGYYTYETGRPPKSLSDIETVNVIFPNLSYKGSGGDLVSGDKVKLGRFEAGISIGVVLLADAWNGKDSESYEYMVFTDPQLNPESDDKLKQHNVLLWDESNELLLLGFEDMNREDPECDQDFNDAILIVTSNPVKAINIENVSPIDKPGTLDRDGDGINDILDEFPDDSERAYTSYYPSSSSYGSFAFEDNWPDYGDYDFNDMVIDYQFKHFLNADNQIVEMESNFKVRAMGAGYRNGFGFATNLLPSEVLSSTGHVVNSDMIKLSNNGTEQNQSNAVFIVANSVHDLFDVAGFINTDESLGAVEPANLTLNTIFNGPKSYKELGSAPYNPFMIVSQDRGREVHLPGYFPTSLVNTEYFGSLDDNSDIEKGIFYRSKTDLPWAIHIPESFDYPKEKADIRDAYTRFKDWAQSFGTSYLDWYRDQKDYRNSEYIYKK